MNRETALQIINETKESYDKIAYKFNETRLKFPWAEFWEFKKYIKWGDKVLDLGCGNGRLVGVLKDLGLDYMGIDFSQELVLAARKNFPGVKFVLGNMIDIDLGTEQYDFVFLLATLHHLPSASLRYNLLFRIQKSLKHGGILFMTNWNLRQEKFFKIRLKHNLKKLFGSSRLDYNDVFIPFTDPDKNMTVQRYIHCFSKKELKKLAFKTHFEIIKQSYGYQDFNHISIWQK